MIPQHITAAASTDVPARRRGGRPKRHVSLSAPTLQPLLGDIHRDATRALSALLLDSAEGSAATPSPSPAGAAPSGDRRSPTAAILDALTVPDAKMPSRPSTRRAA